MYYWLLWNSQETDNSLSLYDSLNCFNRLNRFNPPPNLNGINDEMEVGPVLLVK